MAEDEGTRRWQRFEKPVDPLQAIRSAIAEVRKAPRDPEVRRRLHALGAEQWEQLAVLLADEARAAHDHAVATAFYEELADVHENLDQPLEMIVAMERAVELDPDNVDYHDRLAWLYRRADAWMKAAESYERVGRLSTDERGRAALHAAGKLFRDHGKLDRAATIYNAIVERRATDANAWKALDEILADLGRWQEAARVRGERAARTKGGVEKASLLRSQARALEQAGDARAAASLVAEAQGHAPDSLSGLVDYAEVLAREGKGRDAADILVQRIDDAVDRGAPTDDVAALRLRLYDIFDEQLRDRQRAQMVMRDLLAAAPDFLPALERIAARAARDPDPRAHAEALLKYAAAVPDPLSRGYAVLEAARRYRELGDHKAAIATFEDAATIIDDPAVRRELDDARLAGALADRLVRIDTLEQAGKLDAAAEQLRDVLSTIPETTPGERQAPLVHRFALVMAKLGDDEEAHQLLHEAHRLDRKSLVIQLALGESCFARKIWRQAALHLGGLADHPDVARHASDAARGLVKAAQAEVRALRPQNAMKHYEAAARIDPSCAPAWHALGEAAMERGEVAKAVDLLEKEAQATTEPRDRLRLFDALGDLAADVLGDAERAARCWAQIVDIADAPALEKLLRAQRAKGIVRGETCERLAELTADAKKKKELVEQAVDAYVAIGDVARAMPLAERLMTAHPRDMDAVWCASAAAIAAKEMKRAAQWLERALSSSDGGVGRGVAGRDIGRKDGGRGDIGRGDVGCGDGRGDIGRGDGGRGDRGDIGRGNFAGSDPRRAELWRRLGDAQRALGSPETALSAYRKAVIAAPESDGAMAARRGLVELASAAGESAVTSRMVLVEAEQDPEDVLAWARELAVDGTADEARMAFDLARALGAVLDEQDIRFISGHPVRAMASDEAYAASLDDGELRELVDDMDEGPLAQLFELLAEAATLLCPNAQQALVDADVLDGTRIGGTSDAAVAAIYPQIAKALGGPATLLYTTPRKTQAELSLLFAAPPVVVFGPALANVRARSQADVSTSASSTGDADLRFKLGRIVELSKPRRIFAAQSAESFDLFVRGVRYALGPAGNKVERAVIAAGDRIRGAIPVALRGRVTEWLDAFAGDLYDPSYQTTYLAAVHRAADRAGLLACGDIMTAVELAGGVERARHLVQLAASQKYIAARKKLRPRAVDETTQPFAR